MRSEAIAKEIGALVDHLRATEDQKISLTDIAGQRVSKVVKTLTHIEDRLDAMQSDWAADLGAAETPAAISSGISP
jgi:uncharacterized protein Yka (UPF0111/DUF47 family)